MNLSQTDIELLNSKIGLRKLLAEETVDVGKALRQPRYEEELASLQEQLIALQERVIRNNELIVVIFEGRDAAGKGGAIRRITARINPRHFRIVALPKPTEEERGQWYFQRYVNKLPNPGEIVFFDRSWYNRAVVEPAMGFCTIDEYKTFMRHVNAFEKMITDSGIQLIKLYFSITKQEQEKRFKEISSSPLKKTKITPVDLRAQELWDVYTKYKKAMFKRTDTKNAPWKVINANRKTTARIEAINHILDCTSD
ncbi:MAG: polyphosphate kinase 2 [Crocinitomicaceae bacterium]